MTGPVEWYYGEESPKDPFHYTGCGLDDIYLVSGYEISETPYGPGVTIKNLDGLHEAIGRYLVERKKLLSGAEIRFLRSQMSLTQSQLARLMGYSAQQVARWEKEQSEMPGAAERLLRVLFKEHIDGPTPVHEILEVLDQMDARETYRLLFEATIDGWRSAA